MGLRTTNTLNEYSETFFAVKTEQTNKRTIRINKVLFKYWNYSTSFGCCKNGTKTNCNSGSTQRWAIVLFCQVKKMHSKLSTNRFISKCINEIGSIIRINNARYKYDNNFISYGVHCGVHQRDMFQLNCQFCIIFKIMKRKRKLCVTYLS